MQGPSITYSWRQVGDGESLLSMCVVVSLSFNSDSRIWPTHIILASRSLMPLPLFSLRRLLGCVGRVRRGREGCLLLPHHQRQHQHHHPIQGYSRSPTRPLTPPLTHEHRIQHPHDELMTAQEETSALRQRLQVCLRNREERILGREGGRCLITLLTTVCAFQSMRRCPVPCIAPKWGLWYVCFEASVAAGACEAAVVR